MDSTTTETYLAIAQKLEWEGYLTEQQLLETLKRNRRYI